MSKCHISIEIGEIKNREELVGKARKAIAKHGGELKGDENGGTFDLHIVIGHIAGNYTIEENTFILDVTKKPLLVSCSRIEKEISKYLKEDPSAA
jgi:hypothetical protein